MVNRETKLDISFSRNSSKEEFIWLLITGTSQNAIGVIYKLGFIE